MKLYLSTKPPIDEVGGFTIDLGATYRLPEIGILDGSFFVSPFAKVYENSYAVGVDRVETDTSKFGAKIGLMTTYMAPFNFKNWSTTALVILSKGESNINFFDTEAVTIGGFINYRF